MNTPSLPLPPVEGQQFIVIRRFNASPDQIFAAWTDPASRLQWWSFGPLMAMTCEPDQYEKGVDRVSLGKSDGHDYSVTGVFRLIDAPEQIVMTLDLPDANWEKGAPGERQAGCPICLTVRIQCVDDQTAVMAAFQFPTTVLRDAMLEARMPEGWMQMLERLDNYLATAWQSSTQDCRP